MKFLNWSLLAACIMSGPSFIRANGLQELSLSELLRLDVVSASQRPESLQSMAAAGTIITNQDLENSAALNVMDALRLVPNANIFNLNNQRYIVGLRGFETNNLNQTLVLKDGRSLNTPTLTGIYWHEVNYPFDEVEQVEVIRGPSASHWGSNAVNGVINIISKPAQKTQGNKATVGFGSELSQLYYFRHGGKLDEQNIYYRATVSYEQIEDSGSANGIDFNDDGHSLKGSFRLDRESEDGDSVYSLTAEVFSQEFNERFLKYDDVSLTNELSDFDNDSFGTSIVGTFDRYINYDEVFRLRAYIEYYDRNLGDISQIDTFISDVQLEYEHKPHEKHTLNWALEYRYIHESLEDSFTFDLNSETSKRHLLSLSVEDAIEVLEDEFFLIPAGKYEYHNQTDSEYLGSIKAKWLPTNRHTFWGSIARAVRTPSLAERRQTSRIPNTPNKAIPADIIIVEGNEDLSSEESTSYELGARFLVTDDLFAESNFFYTRHCNLINAEIQGADFISTPTAVLTEWQNNRDGSSWGAEFSLEYHMTNSFRVRSQLGYTKMDLDSVGLTGQEIVRQRTDERLSGSISTEYRPTDRISMNLITKYTSDIETNTESIEYPAYWDADAQVNFQLSDQVTLSIIARNLFREEREEYAFRFTQFEPTVVNRSLFVRLTAEF